MTSSAPRIFFISFPPPPWSQHFGRQRYDPQELLAPQLAGHGSENAGSYGRQLVVQQHGCVAIETDQTPVRTPHALSRPHDHRVHDLTLLNLAAGDRLLDTDLDHIAYLGVSTFGPAEHLDAHHSTRTAVVRHVKVSLHLDHELSPTYAARISNLNRSLDHFNQAPGLATRQRSAFSDGHQITLATRVFLIVRLDLGGLGHHLPVDRVPNPPLHQHRDGLVHLVADHATTQGPGLGIPALLCHVSARPPQSAVSIRSLYERCLFAFGEPHAPLPAARSPFACVAETARAAGPATAFATARPIDPATLLL